MTRSILLAAFLLATAIRPAPPHAHGMSARTAQTAYGRVWLNRDGEVLLAVGATIQHRCPSGSSGSPWANGGTAGDDGTFEFEAPSGACDVRVHFDGQDSSSIPVVFTGDTRLNLELLPRQGGWLLQRR